METILVATDFSAPGTNAVNYAASLAKYFGTKLVLANACPIIVSGDPALPIDMSALIDASSKELEATRKRLIKENYDFGIDYYSGVGSAYSVIKEAADKYGADLIVMGMTGEAGKIKEHLIGSNSLAVARDFTIPAIIVPEGVHYKRIHHISFACDRESMEDSMLTFAARYFTSIFDAELEVVTVEKTEHELVGESPKTFPFMEKKFQALKHRQVCIKDDDAATALEYYFRFHETDLVMVNPKKHSFFRRLFSGSVTSQLAFHSRVPLLIIH
ncbi:MAG: universal stress protein [Bacteroidia bacterium]